MGRDFEGNVIEGEHQITSANRQFEKIYYKDYTEITQKVLFDETSYETSITALEKIIASGVFEA